MTIMTIKPITVTVDGIEYTDIVPQHYLYDPLTEDLIYGDQLQEGMLVIQERERCNEGSLTHRRQLLINNRWCEVTNLRKDESDGLFFLRFMGLYADARKVIRDSTGNTGWIVKKSSIPTDKKPRPPKSAGAMLPRLSYEAMNPTRLVDKSDELEQ